MRTSAALAIDDNDQLGASPPEPMAAASTSIRIPDFGASPALYAATARLAGRVNAASVSDEEHNAWLAERQSLLDKKLAGTITRREANRLTYVRWSLDRIEDAKYGHTLDRLGGAVSDYERFATELSDLYRQLTAAKQRK
jgi:hypothetical protein